MIAHGADRAAALRRLDRALAETELLGVQSSIAFTRELLALDEVREGEIDTGLLERELASPARPAPDELVAAGALAMHLDDTAALTVAPGPWRRSFEEHGEARIANGRLTLGDRSWEGAAWRAADGRVVVELDGVARTCAFVRDVDEAWIGCDGHALHLRLTHAGERAGMVGAGSLEAPMPGTVLDVRVANGDEVAEGDVLLVLESMKMELAITAPAAGTVGGLELERGDRVKEREVLVSVRASEAGGEEA